MTGLAAEDVVRLAGEYGRTKAAFLRLGLGPSRRRSGGMVNRTIACLPALTGAWEELGGGFIRNGWANGTLNTEYLSRPAPEDPPARSVPIMELGKTLLEAKDPRIMALYVYGSNPAAVAPNQKRVLEGLAREDLFVVAHEQMHTDTVDYADIVLPATTFMEQRDLCAASGNRYVQISTPGISPLGEAKSNLDTFRLLAERMGVRHSAYEESFERLVERLLESSWAPQGGWDMEALWAGKAQKLVPPEAPWRQGELSTPSGKFEFYSERLEKMGLSPVPQFVASDEGHLENELKARYPLQLTCAHALNFINGSFADVPASQKLQNQAPSLRLNPADAKLRGLVSGDLCRVFNDRGDCFLKVDVTDAIGPSVCSADTVWWPKAHEGGRNVNQLLSDGYTDLGMGPLYQESLVQVETAT